MSFINNNFEETKEGLSWAVATPAPSPSPTPTPPGFEAIFAITSISTDVFPMFHKHLTQIEKQKRIDLFLYSPGGITIAGYAFVNLFREFCGEFNVIIPFKALSCATLSALGANEIVMTKMGQLSPIDQSVEHTLGPIVQNPGQPGGKIAPVNVEDVNAFIDLAKKEAGLSEEDSMKKVFEILASKVNPLVLGAVQRSREK